MLGMTCDILHLLIAGVVPRTSFDPSLPSEHPVFIVCEQPLPTWAGAFCFLAAAQPARQ